MTRSETMDEFIWGIDIGGTNTVCGLVDGNGNILDEFSLKTRDYEEAADLVDAVCNGMKNIKGVASHAITGIGIGAPNGNYYNGCIEYAPNLKWKGRVELAALFKDRCGLPVVLTNDANAAALGEMYFGGASGLRDFIVITLGTGLGSGFVCNGQLVYGHDGFAGEFGHICAVPGGRPCSCGLTGCLEEYVSARGIKQTMNEVLKTCPEKDRPSFYGKEFEVTDVQTAAKNGNPAALEAFSITGRILGQNLALAVTITSPSHIFLFGGIANAGDLLILPAEKAMNERLLPIFRGKVKITQSRLLGKNAAVIGAAALLLNDVKRK